MSAVKSYCSNFTRGYIKQMATSFSYTSKEAAQDPKFSSGVFMTVWQSLPHRPEVQMLMRQQTEIEQLKSRINDHEMRLTAIEAEVEELRNVYNAFKATIDLILDDQDLSTF